MMHLQIGTTSNLNVITLYTEQKQFTAHTESWQLAWNRDDFCWCTWYSRRSCYDSHRCHPSVHRPTMHCPPWRRWTWATCCTDDRRCKPSSGPTQPGPRGPTLHATDIRTIHIYTQQLHHFWISSYILFQILFNLPAFS